MVARRIAFLSLVIAAASASGAQAQNQSLTNLRQAIAQAGGRVIVTLKTNRGPAVMVPGMPPIAAAELNQIEGRLAAAYPLQMHGQLPIIGAVVATVSDADVARLAADTNVYAIEPDVKNYLTAAMTHSSAVTARPARIRADAIPWGVSDIGAPAAWAAGLTGAGVKVGIMDSGIDYTHSDLNVVGGYNFNTSSSAPSAYNDTDASCGGHGTHVAGIVAAKQNGSGVVGVAPGASLYSLRVFADFGSGCFAYTSAQVSALYWAVTNHLDVVSISIGNSGSVGYATAVASATAAGVVVVAAAGNSGGPGIVYPAAAPGAIAVAALDPGRGVAGYSTSGPEMWVGAPGSGITSTLPGGGYGDKSGTSMATPHVTGIVALIRQAHPTWSTDQVRNEIKSDAIDIASPGFDNNSGWGIVQAPPTGSVPVTIAVNPSARSASVQQGNSAPGDNASVTLSGTNASGTAWSATKKKAWLNLTTASGTGSGTVAWTRNATGLAIGTYVDTITVTASSLTAVVYDTLKITAVTTPITVAVAPAARSVSVVQGNSAPGDNASVTISGTNASTTTRTASNRQPWLTFTNSGGTGNGTISWNRNATGLAVGTYVDTITVTAASASAVMYDTLKITAAIVPVTVAVAPAARSVSVVQGSAAPGDNASVTLSGTNAASTARTASNRQPWLTLTNSGGTGSGTITWTRNATGLAVGTYVDTITVLAASASAVMYDTLKITAAIVPVTVAVAPSSRNVSVVQGNSAPGDNASVTLAGTNAGSTAWTATKRKTWLTLSNANGIGGGTVAWTRNAAGLAVGTYVDTITVTAASATAVVYDTLTITASINPIVVAVDPLARSVSVQQGNPAPSDNASVTMTGANAINTVRLASHRQPWLTFTNSGGTGSGMISWDRNATGLAVGTYVDTITVTAATSTAVLYDTLKITAAIAPVTVAVAPGARSATAVQGSSAAGDNAAVTLSGSNASATPWSATKTKSWLTFTTASGTGNGVVAWTRNTTGLAVGTYVDTITVTAAAASAVVYDTLKITAAIVPVTVAVAPAGRSASAVQGNSAPGDNASVTLSGTNAASTGWAATKKKAWLTLTTAAGTGNGTVAWTRNTTGLAVGTYVDTITVTAAASSAVVYDTLKINAAIVPVTVAVAPAARSASVVQGSIAPGDNAAVTLSGTNASTTGWSASKKHGWLTLSTASGTGSGTVAWTRNAAGLAVGTYVDTITVTAATSSAVVYDTLKITALVVPVTVAVAPAGRSTSVVQGSAAPGDNAAVTLAGTSAGSTPWSATKKQSWLTLTTANGTGSGTVAWTRTATGLAVGTYVDTITVTAASASDVVYDTLKVTAAIVTPVSMSVAPTVRRLSVPQGTQGSGDNVSVTVSGTNAGSSVWTTTHSAAPWASFVSTSGTGNGFVTWNRSTTALAAGTYVDTITVTLAGTGQTIKVFDSLTVTPVVASISVAPHGKKGRALGFNGKSLMASSTDSAFVEGVALDALADAGWVASVSSSRIELATHAGAVSGYLKWSRSAEQLQPGLYVDTVTVSLVSDPSLRAEFIDSLEVVSVSIPVPDVAVGDLFDHRSLTDDQRLALDRQGNINGAYDLGDFLAWVTRNHIRLSAAASLRMKQAADLPPAPAIRTRSGTGDSRGGQ